MSTELAQFIARTPLIDTHEHLHKEDLYVQEGPDVLADLFGAYIGDELVVAGAPYKNVQRLLDSKDPDVAARWAGVEAAWQLCRHTGYGEAVRLMAKLVYGIEELSLESIMGAAERNREIRRPGERLRLLRDVANLDHVQVDDFLWVCAPDLSGPEFFLYDLSIVDFVSARFDQERLAEDTGVAVVDLRTLQEALGALFARYGGTAVAVKTQHAYWRTLQWAPRTDAEAEGVLQRFLTGEELTSDEQNCLGDWCLGQCAALAAAHDLPMKIHTGLLAGHQQYFTAPANTRAAHLAPLLAQYPETDFVLMHIAYPYSDELVAVAKHFPRAYIDMCWSWSINPYHAADFLRRALHALPLNKLFVFGGDCVWPTEVVGFAAQMRKWLTFALQTEIDQGFLVESAAIDIASRLMQDNQQDLFDLRGTRTAICRRMDSNNGDKSGGQA